MMPDGAEHKILLAASEVVGFAKTGGLADVAGSLPRALAGRGHQCAVILPLYRSVHTGPIPISPTGHSFNIPIGDKSVAGRLWQSTLPDSNVPVYLVEQSYYFERDDPRQGAGIYQFTLPSGEKRDYPDNCERYIFFCRAVLEAMRLLDFWPHIVHANDWQTALIPVYLRELRPPDRGLREAYERVRTLFTIHNIAYQGAFWHWDMPLTGLPWSLFNDRQLEFYGNLNLLKAGIVFADLINTVSPTYSREIQTPYYGCGLEGVLYERRDRIFGIVNGVDYRSWNPATDRYIASQYDADSITPGKPECKAALQQRCSLSETSQTPLLGIVSRLAEQKGIDLLVKAAETFLPASGAQLVVLGEGDPAYHRMLLDLQSRFPKQVAVTIAFDEALAHQIEAGADIFLMPSLYEPSGLNQLYSLRYGTVPVVRATGGLADTIVDCTPETLAEGKATGFTFVARTPSALLEALQRALDLYQGFPQQWRRLMQTGMRQDWSWNRSATEYERLYSRLRAQTAPVF
jgi:starch synthase